MRLVKRRGAVVLLAVGVLAALATAGYVYSTSRTPATRFRTAAADRGTIVASVSATGALAARFGAVGRGRRTVREADGGGGLRCRIHHWRQGGP